MSGLINSVKEAVVGKSNTDTSNNDYDNTRDGRGSGLTGSGTQSSDTYGSDNHGPHSSNVGNKLDPRVDSDQDGRRGYDSSNTSSSGQGVIGRVAEMTGLGGGSSGTSHTAGPHSSDMANKADPRVDSDRDGRRGYDSSNTSGSGQGLTGRVAEMTGLGGGSSGASRTAGPHSSDLANKADPRVDSDQDGRRGYDSSNTSGSGQGLTGRVAEMTGLGGSSGASRTAGPHSSDLANKADPRVDSDQDGRRGYDSSNTSGSGQGLAGRVAGMTGLGGSSGTSSTAGPHSSDLANKVDPRVDSDQDGRRGYGSSNTSGSGQGLAGRGNTTEGYGHAEDIVHGGDHYTRTANKLDPHVAGSGPTEGLASGTGLSLGSTSGTGHSQGTTEPHKSSLLNKVDPRVRSDNDGSNTYGGNQTT
jgi:hypothetical protein